jgi:hypothetical protein
MNRLEADNIAIEMPAAFQFGDQDTDMIELGDGKWRHVLSPHRSRIDSIAVFLWKPTGCGIQRRSVPRAAPVFYKTTIRFLTHVAPEPVWRLTPCPTD